LHSVAFRETNNIRQVGRLHVQTTTCDRWHDRITYAPFGADLFWSDLRAEVRKQIREKGLQTHYTAIEAVLLLLWHMAVHSTWIYITFFAREVTFAFKAGSAVFGGFYGIMSSASVAHAATHFGFSQHWILNKLALHFFDFAGKSWLEWQMMHQAHHDGPHSSLDAQTFGYKAIAVRLHQRIPYLARYAFQHIYCWFGMSLYHIAGMWNDSKFAFNHRDSNTEFLVHLAIKSILPACALWSAQQDGLVALALSAFYSVSFSLNAFLLLFNDHAHVYHVLSDAPDAMAYSGEGLSWAKVQVQTSGDWKPINLVERFVEWSYGYFNYHIEHHLFPHFRPSLYPEIAPVVALVCQKHGVTYTSSSLFERMQSFEHHLRTMGVEWPVE